MKKVLVESVKKFPHGFLLTEQELRRIIESAVDQLDKISTLPNSANYTINYENGVIEETKDIEEVLSLENSGSTKINSLEIELSKTNAHEDKTRIKDPHKIVLEFNARFSKSRYSESPLVLYVSGESRDWVFVTTSMLEERIQKIRTFSFIKLSMEDSIRYFTLFVVTLLFIGMLLALNKALNINTEGRIHELDSLRNMYHKVDSINIADIVIDIQKQQLTSDYSRDINKTLFSTIAKSFLFGLIFLVLCLLGYWFMNKMFPPYNFVWGDYIEVYQRKKSIRNIVFIIIGLGIIISAVGSLIANKLG